jgi:hypothetical protein
VLEAVKNMLKESFGGQGDIVNIERNGDMLGIVGFKAADARKEV